MYHGWVTVVKRNYDSHRFFYEFLSHGRVLHPPSSPSTESQFYYSFSLYTCPLLKKSSGNTYLKICDLLHYFFADAPMRKRNLKNLVYDGVQHFLDTKYKIFFCFNQKNLFTNPHGYSTLITMQTLVEIIFRYH